MTDSNDHSSPSGDPAATDTSRSFDSLYDRAIDSLLDIAVTDRWVDTSTGRTHLLTAGSRADPPILVFQGGNVTTPITLSWVQGLADQYHLLAPDTPGQPGKTHLQEPVAFGPWVSELLDGLHLDSAILIGISHGAGVALEAAVELPERIDAAALLVPAGFGTTVSLDLLRIVLPALAYRLFPRRRLLERALAPMFTESMSLVDPVIIETVGKALTTGDLRAEFPGPDDPSLLASFQAPTLVLTAEHDPFFPGKRTCKRAHERLPTLDECVMLAGERHFLSPEGQTTAVTRIQQFLSDQDSLQQQ